MMVSLKYDNFQLLSYIRFGLQLVLTVCWPASNDVRKLPSSCCIFLHAHNWPVRFKNDMASRRHANTDTDDYSWRKIGINFSYASMLSLSVTRLSWNLKDMWRPNDYKFVIWVVDWLKFLKVDLLVTKFHVHGLL